MEAAGGTLNKPTTPDPTAATPQPVPNPVKERPMTAQDRKEFKSYLRSCTDKQVQGVYDKERAAGRSTYAEMAQDEAERREIQLHD